MSQVGFNAGNGTQSFEYHPYSQRSNISQLVSDGWVNKFPGRHIFRIDENIVSGTCNENIGKYFVLHRLIILLPCSAYIIKNRP